MMSAALTQPSNEHQGWDVMLGRGEWVATRNRVLTQAEISNGLRCVLTECTIARLRGALYAQRVIEQQIESDHFEGSCS